MKARIFCQPPPATQSGRAGAGDWVLEWAPMEPRVPDPLMGWWGSHDTQAQVQLRFATREAAVAFAEQNGISFEIALPPPAKFRPKVYADNFRYDRKVAWTH